MSDTTNTKSPQEQAVEEVEAQFPEYKDREAEDLNKLESNFRVPIQQQYVAAPAPGHDVHGLWHTFDAHSRTGYSAHAMALQWMLSRELKIPTQLIAHPYQDIDIDKFPEDRYDFLFNAHKEAVGFPHMVLSSYPPEVTAPMGSAEEARYAIGPNLIPYCAFEAMPVSGRIVEACNHPKLFREIWTVSEFARTCFTESGVDDERVRVIRPPICDGPWSMVSLDTVEEQKRQPVTKENPFTFGVLGSWHRRKGMHDLLRAYFNEFDRQEPVRLWVRTSWFGEGVKTIKDMKAALAEEIRDVAHECGHHGFPEAKTNAKLKVTVGTGATDQEVVQWISSLDAYANSSYGEGLGIPHVWAKAHGIPLVSSDYGAVGDMLKEFPSNNDAVFSHQMGRVDPEILTAGIMFSPQSEWGRYEVSDLSKALRAAYEHGAYEQGRVFDRLTAESVREAFSNRTCVVAVREAIKQIVPQEQVDQWNL